MPIAMIGVAVQTGVAAMAVFLLVEGSWLRTATGLQLSPPTRVLAIAVIVLLLVGTYDQITAVRSLLHGEPAPAG